MFEILPLVLHWDGTFLSEGSGHDYIYGFLGWRNDSAVTVLAGFAENPRSVSMTHLGQLTLFVTSVPG